MPYFSQESFSRQVLAWWREVISPRSLSRIIGYFSVSLLAVLLLAPTAIALAARVPGFSGLPAINYLLLGDDVAVDAILPPANQFNVGDSIGIAEAANGTIGSENRESVWSTGYAASDSVHSLNERFEARDTVTYYQNTASRDAIFNHASSGAEMADFVVQAGEVVSAAAGVPGAKAGMVTVLLGSNDVCAADLDSMTDPALFEAQFRSGLDILAASERTRSAQIHITSIPDLYWLWEAKRSNLFCRIVAWPFVPCENLLDNPEDDCAENSSLNPDVIDAQDGPDCERRKQFHARIRDQYNAILENVVEEYQTNASLPNADYIDIFDVRFGAAEVNSGDCFHPSEAGQALLARENWCRSGWGENDAMCVVEP